VVKITPLGEAGRNQSRSLYAGSAVSVSSSSLSSDASELSIKKLKLSIQNNTADSIEGSQLLVEKLVTDTGTLDLRDLSNVATVVGPGSGPSDGPGPSVTISQPTGIVRDVDGTVYLAGSADGSLRRLSDGFVTRIATGLSSPGGVAVSGTSAFLLEQSTHNLVRVPTAGGSKFLMAGGGVSGLVDGAGAAARFNAPRDIEIVGTTAFISDFGNDRIRTATNLAGGSATVATLNVFPMITGPSGLGHLSLAGVEWLVVTSTTTHKVYLVNSANGQSFIIAGTGVTSSMDGPGNTATFNAPFDATVSGGAIFVSDLGGRLIRQVSLSSGAQPQFASSWIVKTVAGVGTNGSADGIGNVAQFGSPRFLASDGAGAILVSDLTNNRTRKLTAASGVFPITGSGGGSTGTISVANPDSFVPDPANFLNRRAVFDLGTMLPAGGAGDTVEREIEFVVAEGVGSFSFVVSLVGDGSSIGVLDAVANAGLPITGSSNVNVRTLTGIVGSGMADGSPMAARFDGVTIYAANGVIYGADGANDAIRRFDPVTGLTTTIAGVVRTGATMGGSGTTSRLDGPVGIWMNESETEGYVSLYAGSVIVRLSRPPALNPTSSNSWSVTIIAGAADSPGNVLGAGNVARFVSPAGMTADPSGSTVYMSDNSLHQVRVLTIAGGLDRDTAANWNVSLGAGDPVGGSGDTDGNGTSARFTSPTGMALAKDGNLYIAESNGRRIRRMTPDHTVTILAGSTTGVPGAVDAIGTNARFAFPVGIGLDNSGYGYVADEINECVRRINLTSGEVRTVAGISGMSALNLDGPGNLARFSGIQSPAFVPGKGVYVGGQSCIRLIERVIRNGNP
jgi:hypothetical protein